MEVHLTPEQEAQLQEIAAWRGLTPAQLIQEAVCHLLDEDKNFTAAIQAGIDSLDRGEYLTEEEMAARVQEMLRH